MSDKFKVILIIGLLPLWVAIPFCVVIVSPLIFIFSLITHFFPKGNKKKTVKEKWSLEKSKIDYAQATKGLATRRDYSVYLNSKEN